jgi:hypothetical protein
VTGRVCKDLQAIRPLLHVFYPTWCALPIPPEADDIILFTHFIGGFVLPLPCYKPPPFHSSPGLYGTSLPRRL